MAEVEFKEDTYAYCPGECGAQVNKELYETLTQKNSGSPAVCGDPHGVGCSRKGEPLIVR
ncbi:MAG: hypothetical protein QGG34_01135 [SAR202 cluster bacterium]|mgnify:FL=1|jgi:hypothetical protein|nr:hypothetical protein [SAR202 cluster bacterium]MDP6301981.1 hypothetical protein [SAR202 cluster bacterium]MDP7102441.1 hypothetical protein [SAR202 cluster bacterium]MDP7224871.1 hypothetical protein [SAR202 cluster bacterium]MDP7412047.1 hypothetical protein [SAR202 cluster bacterium]|tara:strand:+ start:2811 stop:2990 length:180 start_codon:yes stop_codon:yes gene_type:complete